MPARGQPRGNVHLNGGRPSKQCMTPGCGHPSNAHSGIAASRDVKFRRCSMPDCQCRNYLTSEQCSRCSAYLPNRRVVAKVCEPCEEKGRAELAARISEGGAR